MSILLLALILVPAVAAVLCLLAPPNQAKNVAFGGTLVVLAMALALLGVAFDGRILAYAPDALQVPGLGTGLKLGIEPIGYWLVLLTAVLMPLVVFSSGGSVVKGERGYYFWLMLLMTPMIGVFLARDAILFYVFFELTLVPMFFLIGVWGGDERLYAAKKFFLYTFVGGVFTLAALVYVGVGAGSFDIGEMAIWAQSNVTNPATKVLLFAALAAGFAVKVPLFPVHTWLPLAHTVAPTAGSVILAGVLLKLGTYGLLAVVLPIGLLSDGGVMPVVANSVIPVVAVLSIIGVIYGALIAWVQEDVKKLVAYSSVSHLGFCVLGLIALNDHGMQGSVFYMINHGISTGALFLMNRHDLRPLPHPHVPRLLGAGEGHAGLQLLPRAVHDEQHRPAGHERVRQRVPDDPRRFHQPVPRPDLRGVRGNRRDFGGRVHAAHGGPADLRPAQAAAGVARRPDGDARLCGPGRASGWRPARRRTNRRALTRIATATPRRRT